MRRKTLFASRKTGRFIISFSFRFRILLRFFLGSDSLACRGGVEDDAHPGGVEGEVEEATEKWPEEPAGDEGEGGRLLKMKKMLEGCRSWRP
jgi:hypothetical protein